MSMFDIATGKSPLTAYDELMRFATRGGAGALRLAMHAAVPQSFRPDLLHLLRLNFVPEADGHIAEADVLLAPFCDDLGDGYFQLDPLVRRMLLDSLADQYPDDVPPRVQRAASFLAEYVERCSRGAALSGDRLWRDYLETQRWVALAFLNPDGAASQLAAALDWARGAGAAARVQIGGLAAAISIPLARHRDLLTYAVGLQALESGQSQRGRDLLASLGDTPVVVGDTKLRPAPKILQEWEERTSSKRVSIESTRAADVEQKSGVDAPTYTYDVFVSYSQADQDWVQGELLPRLEAARVRYIEQLEFVLGRPRLLEIDRAVNESRWTLLILTQSYLDDSGSQFDAHAADSWRTILAIKGDCELPARLATLASIDLRAADEATWQRLIATLSSPSPGRSRLAPFMVPHLPADFVPRPVEFERIVAHLLENSAGPVAISAALRGMGGYGKTTLAAAVCHDDRVRAAFPDGILWVTLGEKPTVADLVGKIDDLIVMLTGGPRAGFVSLEAATTRLAEVLGDRRLLLVVDDVWDAEQLRPFLHGGPHTARLITTRNRDTLPAETRAVDVDAMRHVEALALLGDGLPDVSAHRTALQTLATRLGEWPLLLTLVNAALRERVRVSQSLDEALAYVNLALDRRGLTTFDLLDPAARSQAVSMTIDLSLNLLTDTERVHYTELTIFPEDVDVPLVTVSRLWNATGGIDNFDSELLCARLAELSLLKLDLAQHSVHLNDVMRAHLTRERVDDLPRLHATLLDTYRPTSGAWADMPADEPYLWDYLMYHLRSAGRREEEVVATVKDPRYLATKSFLRRSSSVISDLANARQITLMDDQINLLSSAFEAIGPQLDRCSTQAEVDQTLARHLLTMPELALLLGVSPRFAVSGEDVVEDDDVEEPTLFEAGEEDDEE